jgi:Holliday junction resolvase RusA-like endonuclease
MDELRLVLDGERPKSWNLLYAGTHWRVRKQEADRVHLLVLAALGGRPARLTRTVDIEIVAFFKGKPLDSDNICGKMYIDGLIYAGLLVNDTRAYVRRFSTQSEVDRDKPRVEITIREIAA